jgi:putative oxidoreductase
MSSFRRRSAVSFARTRPSPADDRIVTLDPALAEAIGRYLLVVLYLGTALINSTCKVKQHQDRIAAVGIPVPGAMLWFGFALQYAGSLMLLFDWHKDIGAMLLIVFTIAATAIFHRYWQVEDPLRRHMHFSFIFSNIGLCGALVMLMAK